MLIAATSLKEGGKYRSFNWHYELNFPSDERGFLFLS